MSLGAGLATGIGGAVAVPQIFASVKQGVILSVALAISAGVMLYVSFIEIFVKAQAEIEKSLGPSGAAATAAACFFAGMLFCVVSGCSCTSAWAARGAAEQRHRHGRRSPGEVISSAA